ncbi:Hydroxypyruvate reductase [Andreprevotia sp. IGB-42]|uniref:D-isomer specific 2-hydroxyacid dehydrogenase family protein n=1 Tax=Andreprevotia sp. IGB-42 TaxID=2497473 RepID=UPI00135A24F9|nr:D-isomer specific 2-hydroxyacid dehydrogenase family protein [Andreprevotia sp. IGB-42]KAF0812643.1 Hydroxypyruvate reductase [Andreprevotia sp. IGB-42]
MSIVIASQLDDRLNNLIRAQVPDARVVGVAPGVPDTLPDDAEVLFVRPFRPFGVDLNGPPPKGWPFGVRWVQLASAGIDFYPPWLFDGPVVTSARGTAAEPIAEFALAAILAAAKHFPHTWISQASDWKWQPVTLLAGSTLGIFGFGAIGQALARKALALGIKVITVRRSDADPGIEGVERVADIGELFALSDHVVLAAPATAATRHIVNQQVLARAKPGLHLVNVARGSLIDDAALLTALAQGQIALASLDVTEPEPLPPGHPYYSHPQVRLSPHTSAISPRIFDDLASRLVQNLAAWRSGAALTDVVDPARGY